MQNSTNKRVGLEAHRHRHMQHAYPYYSRVTHSLGIEGRSGWCTGHLDDRKRVPFSTADPWRVDVYVRPSLECVTPDYV